MEELIKKQKLHYFECQKGGLHEGEQLNFVCIEPGCKECGLICSICRLESHGKHFVQPLKMFLCEVSKKLASRTSTGPSNLDELLLELDSKNQSILYNLREVVENLAATIRQFEIECENTTKRVRDRIVSQVFLSDNIPKIIESIANGEYTDGDLLKAECKKLVESLIFNDKKVFEIDIRPGKSLEKFSEIEQEIVKTLQKASKTFIESIKKLDKTFEKTQSSSETQTHFTFANPAKSSTISITQNKELSSEHPTRFAFQPKNISSFVGFGVCLQSVLEKKGYIFDSNQVGHGTYLISQNGYAWSHSSKEDNMVNKSFLFKAEEIIICEYDPIKKQLSFRKHKHPNRFTLTLDIPAEEKVFPCVNICNSGDKVEIINNLDLSAEEF